MLRTVDELEMEEYLDCVVASGEDDFQQWCEEHDVDYEDAMAYDWD